MNNIKTTPKKEEIHPLSFSEVIVEFENILKKLELIKESHPKEHKRILSRTLHIQARMFCSLAYRNMKSQHNES